MSDFWGIGDTLLLFRVSHLCCAVGGRPMVVRKDGYCTQINGCDRRPYGKTQNGVVATFYVYRTPASSAFA